MDLGSNCVRELKGHITVCIKLTVRYEQEDMSTLYFFTFLVYLLLYVMHGDRAPCGGVAARSARRRGAEARLVIYYHYY